MIYIIKISAIILLISFTQVAHCQKNTGIVTVAENFSKVIAFTKQPYLYYKTITKMNAIPVFEPGDTATLTGEFFKYKDDFYSNNGMEEIYVQDSFLVHVNHEHKSIWISKVDIASKKRMDMLPVTTKQLQVLILKNYATTQKVLNDSVSRVDFSANEKNNNKATATSFGIEYNSKSFLPNAIEIKAKIRQVLEDELLTTLDNEHIDSHKLFEVIGGIKFLVRTQEMYVAFSDINNTKEVAKNMPSWKAVLEYDLIQNEFKSTLSYTGYEVTATF